MRDALRRWAAKRWQAPLFAAGLSMFATAPAPAQTTSLEDLVSAVVAIKTFINPDARTTETLGREREGSGIVIDEDGLVLTIGYLMVEAHAAEVTTNAGRAVPANVVGYDHETGFGLLRTIEPLKLKPLGLGKSGAVQEGDPALVASFGGPQMVAPVRVVSKRPFAGSWEYLLDQALYTAPPHPIWSGAALISREGKLIGVGSLIVGDATGGTDKKPGNMFVPIDLLPPILADLIADGRTSGPAQAVARGQCGGRQRPPAGRTRHRRRPGREGRHRARRPDRRRQWRGDQDDGRVLPQGLGARHCRRHHPARRRAGRGQAAHRDQIDEPPRPFEAQVDVLEHDRFDRETPPRHCRA